MLIRAGVTAIWQSLRLSPKTVIRAPSTLKVAIWTTLIEHRNKIAHGGFIVTVAESYSVYALYYKDGTQHLLPAYSAGDNTWITRPASMSFTFAA